MGIETIVVPSVNGPEAMLVPGVRVIAAVSLPEAIACLSGEQELPVIDTPASHVLNMLEVTNFADVRGRAQAKRALEIAAAGGHNVLLSGSPGSGKRTAGKALCGILPPLSRDEALEVTGIYSVANLLPSSTPLILRRPLRTVHHTASGVAIVGGGRTPAKYLAHRGVLFSRRTRRVSDTGTGSAASATGRPMHHHQSCEWQCDVSIRFYSGCCHEPT